MTDLKPKTEHDSSSQDENTNQVDYLLAAIMFYTRLPVSNVARHSDDILHKSRIYFPVIGWLIGSIGVMAYFIAEIFLPSILAILLSIIATVLGTGAFHEDGFADCCDGFGGGWDKEQVLHIMKDSRLGTYATIGLVLILASKFASLLELSQLGLISFALVYLNGHTFSRICSSLVIERFTYVQDIDKSKIKPIANAGLSIKELQFSMLLAALPLILLAVMSPALYIAVIFATLLAAAIAYLFARYSERRIGGYTGDVLGAIQQLSEVAFYIGILIVV